MGKGKGAAICHLGLAAREAPPGSRAAGRNLNLVYTQINEHTFLPQTLRLPPQEGQARWQARWRGA